MKRTFGRLSLMALTVSMVAATAWAQHVNVDYDRDVDFSKYNTYAWRPGQPAANPLVDKRILTAVDKELTAKGWTRTEASPGAIVTYQTAIGAERRLNAWGSGPRWGGWSGTVNAETILTGQLVVDVYDAVTRQLMWRGITSDTATDNAHKNEKRLNEAVAKLFKQFPPPRGRSTK